jgi:PAS domain S-box-containing protein
MARPSESKLRAENEELRLRLEEAEQALEAIRTGQVESLVLEGPDGPRIFSLEGATQSYRTLVESMNEGAVTLREDGTVLYCNARFARMLGEPLQQVMGSSLGPRIPEHSRAAFGELLERARESAVREEITLCTPDGREIPAYLSVSSIVDDGRRVLCLVATDLREQKRAEAIALAEQAARESEERLRQTLTYAAAGTWEWGIATGALAWSPQIYDLYGVDPSERPVTYADWERLLHPDDLAATQAAVTACIEGRTPEFRAEFRVRNPRRGDRWLLGVGKVERAADGAAIRMLGLDIDITDRKRVEGALHNEERRFRSLFENSVDAVYLTRVDGTILDANPAACRMHDMAVEEIRQRGRVGLVVHDERHAAAIEERAAVGHVRAEMTHLRRDGSQFPAEVQSVVVDAVQGTAFVIARDITERKRAEEELHHALADLNVERDKLAEMVRALPVGVVTMDPRGHVLSMNDAALRLHGFGSHREMHETLAAYSRRFELRDTAGRPLPVEEWPASRAMRGEPVSGYEVLVRNLDAGTEHVVAYTAITFRGSSRADPALFVFVMQDVSDARRAERAIRRANERLRDADRRKDEFLGMLSHELRNPLAPIRNSTYILRHADPGSDHARRAQSVIERQTQHLTRLVDDLLDVTRIARGKIDLRRERVDLRDVVRRTAEDLRSVIESRGVTFRVDVPDANVWADVDQTRLAQAIGNMLNNAAKFTHRGDSVALSLECDRTNAQIRVHDTGAGIDASLLPSVFDAFVQGERTLARTEGGLGLGLALVKGIVELHGGKVSASSAGVGRGSEFVLSIPVAPPSGKEDRPVSPAPRRLSGRRVLVVDDNVDAAETLADTLRFAGHEVEVAFDGPDAIEKVRLGPPDVVLCDIGLPGMSGYEVARRLRASGANGMQLIAVSGYAQPEDVKKAIDAGFDGHVAKPCDPEQIERLLT